MPRTLPEALPFVLSQPSSTSANVVGKKAIASTGPTAVMNKAPHNTARADHGRGVVIVGTVLARRGAVAP